MRDHGATFVTTPVYMHYIILSVHNVGFLENRFCHKIGKLNPAGPHIGTPPKPPRVPMTMVCPLACLHCEAQITPLIPILEGPNSFINEMRVLKEWVRQTISEQLYGIGSTVLSYSLLFEG